MALKDGEMLVKTNEEDQSPAIYIENCSQDLSMNCSITSSNKNSVAHTQSPMSQASQYYSSGEGNSVAFDIRNIISEDKSHLWQHSVEDLLHAEILISLKSGFTAGKTELSSSYMEQSLSEPPSHQKKKRKYEDLKSENNDFMIDSIQSLNNKWKIDAEGTAEKCPNHHVVCDCAKTRDVYLSARTRSHSSLISFKCRICGKKFADNGTLCLHVKLHKTLRLYKCHVCDKVFQHSFALKLHMKMHKTKDASTAWYSNTGRATLDSKSSAEESIYECDNKSAKESIYECDSKSSDQENIYEFEVSGKRLQQDGPVKKNHFSSSQYLSISSKTYQNCFGRLQCLSCPKSFSNHHQLQIHAVYHSEPMFKCLMCDKAFYHMYRWQVHQILHTGMPQYVCRICNRSFLFSFSLRMHMRLHTSLRILHRMLQSAQGSNSRAITARTKNTRQLL
ncbi:hypothetical protein CHS0354_036610 [Potamilus streckersoni]|nr:hypothetical protein CHS0354_036610 [Potamilus streckersoni]